MGWLFGRKKAVPKVPFPEGKPYDEKALRFPTSSSRDRIIEPESVKAAVGFDKPVAFPEEEPMMEDQLPAPPIFPFSRTSRPMTTPEFMPIMKKAAAIVTEQGGITSHAAIVARELGKPCVIGTKIATSALRDGEVVEVDANNGIVRREK